MALEPALEISPAMGVEAVTPPDVADDDAVRANTYGLLGALLANPPRNELFGLLAGMIFLPPMALEPLGRR